MERGKMPDGTGADYKFNGNILMVMMNDGWDGMDEYNKNKYIHKLPLLLHHSPPMKHYFLFAFSRKFLPSLFQ
jgi:hypothetical protein